MIAFAVIVGLAVSLVMLSTFGGLPGDWLERLGPTGNVLRGLVVLLTTAFSAYVLEKERHLRRLSRALMEERVHSAALSVRLRDIATLTEAGKAVLSAIELEDVLGVIVRSASELLSADEGSVLLSEGDGFVVAAATGRASAFIGERHSSSEGLGGYAATHRKPLLIEGRAEEAGLDWPLLPRETSVLSAMSVPLMAKGELFGVLNLSVTSGPRRYTEYDLRALSLFGEHAAIAVRHARMLHKERMLRAELAERDRVRNQLVASMTHDLKSPLTVILGSVQLLLTEARGIPEGQRVELLGSIERGSKRLLRLVDQLLEAARSQASHPLTKAWVNLAELVQPLATSFQTAHRKSIEVLQDAPVYAEADPEALDQVLSVLLENACVHTPPETRVSVSISQHGDRAEVCIADDGPGIRPEDKPFVFEPFRRGGSVGGSGAGLGMFIASNLVQAMDGEISVDGGPGEGTIVRFTLPAYVDEQQGSHATKRSRSA